MHWFVFTHRYSVLLYNTFNLPFPRRLYSPFRFLLKDTHIYHNTEIVGTANTDIAFKTQQQRYSNDICAITKFHQRQSGGVIIGEWSLAGPAWTKHQNQRFAHWLVQQFMDRTHGAFYWNWDADINEWSFQKSQAVFEIDWTGLAVRTTTTTSRSSLPSYANKN